MTYIVNLVTIIIDLVFIVPLFTSVIYAIRDHENYINVVKKKYLKMFDTVDDFNSYLIIIIPIIVFFNIGNLITSSAVNVQIGSFFEADEFTAKYQATIKVIDNGDLSENNTLIQNINEKTVEVIIQKNTTAAGSHYTQTFYGEDNEYIDYHTAYYINSIEYQDYSLIDDSDELTEIKVNKPVDFTPTKIYRNGKNYRPYNEETGYCEQFPTFEVKLSNTLVENLTNTDHSALYFDIISYTLFMCLFVIYLTWTVYRIKKSKKTPIIVFIIALLVSILLIVLPLSYIISNDPNKVSAQASQIDEQDCIYLLNPDSMKIHNENCYTIKHKENYIETIDYEKAIDEGYEPCKICDP